MSDGENPAWPTRALGLRDGCGWGRALGQCGGGRGGWPQGRGVRGAGSRRGAVPVPARSSTAAPAALAGARAPRLHARRLRHLAELPESAPRDGHCPAGPCCPSQLWQCGWGGHCPWSGSLPKAVWGGGVRTCLSTRPGWASGSPWSPVSPQGPPSKEGFVHCYGPVGGSRAGPGAGRPVGSQRGVRMGAVPAELTGARPLVAGVQSAGDGASRAAGSRERGAAQAGLHCMVAGAQWVLL